jgi:hypothetical protein
MSTQGKSAFVFAVVGTRHVLAASVALEFLKRVTRHDIIVVQSRSERRAAHDQVIEVETPATLDDHQASICLKTNLLPHVRGLADRFCYLDSDVIAIDTEVDRIFDHVAGPVTFAHDHAEIDAFSGWAVNCGCREPRCNHLREALLCTFDIDVRRPDYRMWNGGVFLFDDGSADFLAQWHRMCLAIMAEPYWRTRDQGTLAAAAWRFGIQDQPVLPRAFNFIVDCMKDVAPARRASLAPEESFVRTDYALGAADAPHFLHFVNGGVGRRGWRNWDDVERLLAEDRAA